MKSVRIADIKEYNEQTVQLNCWLYNKRSSGKIRFLQLRDGSADILQAVVVKGEADDATFGISGDLTQESSLIVTGTVREHGRKPGVYELGVAKIEVIQMAALDYPISHKEHGPEYLMSHRHLWLRTPRQAAIMRIRSAVMVAIRNFFDQRGFICMDAPILTGNSCEGTSTLFKTDYFGEDAYLSQTGQLYGEVGAMAVGKAYVFGPTFRAEKSKTRKHLTEFWMVEPEVAFMNIEEDIQLAEDFVVHILRSAIDRCKADLEILERDLTSLEKAAEGNFKRITYTDSIDLLQKNGHELNWGDDLGAPEETKLGSLFDDRPVFITEFPKELKSFYFKTNEKNPKTVLGLDLIAPDGYGEIIGGGERETSYDVLLDSIKSHKLDEEEYKWYLDLRKYGSVPHAGFGLGFERTIAWICGTKHIRETIAFPRTLNYLRP